MEKKNKKQTDWYLKKQQNKENFFSKHFTDQKITSVILTAVFGDSEAELSFWIGKRRTCLFGKKLEVEKSPVWSTIYIIWRH